MLTRTASPLSDSQGHFQFSILRIRWPTAVMWAAVCCMAHRASKKENKIATRMTQQW